ncbi:hypothetical protein HanRHA438_Chr09g0416421 [Helianthus annuus]|nr:hypothetical protein HanRHA438_Chr09g0416421 [Helianthus annuus]
MSGDMLIFYKREVCYFPIHIFNPSMMQNLQAWITLIGEKLDATLSKHITSSIPLPSGTTT